MGATQTINEMSDEGRALLTDREKEIISGDADVTKNYQYKVESIVRNRIRKRFNEDVAFLKEHFPEVHDLVVNAACEDARDE